MTCHQITKALLACKQIFKKFKLDPHMWIGEKDNWLLIWDKFGLTRTCVFAVSLLG